LAKSELSNIVDSLLGGKHTFFYGKKICTGLPVDFHRCLAEWSRRSSVDKAIRNIMVSSFYSTEASQGGSGLISCLLWLDKVEFLSRVKKAEKKDIENVLESWGRSGISFQVSKKIFYFGACGSEVKLQEGAQLGTKIRVLEGENIDGHVDNLFLIKNPDMSFSGNSYVVAIDGVVENISQIHHLIEKHEKEKIVIAALGFLPDVTNTLSENYFAKRLGVIPFVVEDWCVENFLDLESSGISCASSAMGSEIRCMKMYGQKKIKITPDQFLFSMKGTVKCRKIMVSFGKDLGDLRGISIDRTKTLLSLSRFSARSGVSKCKFTNHEFYIPNSSLETAKRSTHSLHQILQNLGGVITLEK
jgi:predicted nucleic-acid-binding protein